MLVPEGPVKKLTKAMVSIKGSHNFMASQKQKQPTSFLCLS